MRFVRFHLVVAKHPADDMVGQVRPAVIRNVLDQKPVQFFAMSRYELLQIANRSLRGTGPDATRFADEPDAFARHAKHTGDVGIAQGPIDPSPLLRGDRPTTIREIVAEKHRPSANRAVRFAQNANRLREIEPRRELGNSFKPYLPNGRRFQRSGPP